MPPSRESNVARRKQVGFAVIAAAIFGGLLVYGLHPWAPGAVSLASAPAATASVGASEVREDDAIPKCDSVKTIETITGQLVRSQKTRVSGLSNVAEVASDGHGGRTCTATVDLDFGPKPVTYVIRQVAPGKKTWEMDLTGP